MKIRLALRTLMFWEEHKKEIKVAGFALAKDAKEVAKEAVKEAKEL